MKINVARKVKEINLKPNEFLLPLFEVVINAIHAIEERNIKHGKIKIQIIRDKTESSFLNSNINYPIDTFIVEDNGIGFNEETFNAFNDAYTEYKAQKGGKGVGRFIVLKAFKKMVIDSCFQKNGNIFNRIFEFDIHNEVKELEIKENINCNIGSKVTLLSYLPDYKKHSSISIEELSEKLVNHCIIYFLTDSMPEIIIKDDKKEINLNKIFNQYILSDKKGSFELSKFYFDLYYLKREKNKRLKNHYFHFCAHNRIVETHTIKNYIPNFSKPINENGKEYFLSIYITSKYFDENLNEIRNSFTFPRKISEKKETFLDILSFEEIISELTILIEKKYENFINKINNEKLKKIKEFILDENGIEYRHLLKAEEKLKSISPENLNEDNLELELHKINYELEKEHRKNIKNILKKSVDNYDDYIKELHKILKKENEFNHSRLANYIVRRKAILNVLDKFLQIQDDGKYIKEEVLHNIIFPMGEESDTIPYNQHNLWLLDERLTFHTYIVSDKKIKVYKTIESNSLKEPDLAIFDKRWVYSPDDNFSSIVIFEFKRPGRELETNLDSQIREYFKELMEGKTKTYNGKSIDIEKYTPKFGYIIGDISKKLRKYLTEWENYKFTPNKTLFKYWNEINLYIEILTFDQILKSAKERHRAFFKMLGIE